MNKKQIIVMMGGPGVGKGTLSQMLLNQQPYKHIEAGAILRALPSDSEICKLISAGNLIPDELICDIIAPQITEHSDMILDGFPRTIGQAKWLVEKYANKYDIHVLYLYTNEETLIKRIQKRARSGSHRADDSALEIIRNRLNNFQKTTMPAVEWLRTAPGIKFSPIDANGDENSNFTQIIAALK